MLKKEEQNDFRACAHTVLLFKHGQKSEAQL